MVSKCPFTSGSLFTIFQSILQSWFLNSSSRKLSGMIRNTSICFIYLMALGRHHSQLLEAVFLSLPFDPFHNPSHNQAACLFNASRGALQCLEKAYIFKVNWPEPLITSKKSLHFCFVDWGSLSYSQILPTVWGRDFTRPWVIGSPFHGLYVRITHFDFDKNQA